MSNVASVRLRGWLRAIGFSGLLGVVLLATLGLLAATGPMMWRVDPEALNVPAAFAGPRATNPLGTDNFGRDELARLLAGARVSLPGAVAVLAGSTMVGLAVGVTAGMVGGTVDRLLSRLTDALLSLPSLVIALGIVGALGTSLANLVLALILTGWPWHARIYRGFVVAQLHAGYVLSARAIGCSTLRIAVRHVGPNIVGQVVVVSAASLGGAVLGLASLSFLGLGVRPPASEWGAMVNEARPYFQTHPWLGIAPASAIGLTVLAANLVGDAFRDLSDPRLRQRSLSVRRSWWTRISFRGRDVSNEGG